MPTLLVQEVIHILYCDKTIKNGKIVIMLANVAPAPSRTNIDGRAQHINVDDDAKSDKKFADLSSI